MAIPAVIDSYYKRGFRLVFFPPDAKGPYGPDAKGWTEWSHTTDDYARLEKQYGKPPNVGCFTGVEIEPGRFLHDVDFDWADGLQLAKRILPDSAFGFGRTSRPISHIFYTTSKAHVTVEYTDIDGQNLVEFRGTKLDGSIGLETMMPPSHHEKSGETVTLKMDGDIGHDDNLPRLVAEQVVNDAQYRQTLLDRARAGTLPPDVEMFLLETADGRLALPVEREQPNTPAQSRTLALVPSTIRTFKEAE